MNKINFTNGKIIHDKRKVVGICKMSDITDDYIQEFFNVDDVVHYDVKEIANAIASLKNLVPNEPITISFSIKEPCPVLIYPERMDEDDPCISIAPIVSKGSKWWV